jgi:hypothetical protein
LWRYLHCYQAFLNKRPQDDIIYRGTGFSLFAEHLAADLVADVLPAVLFDILPFTRVISPIIELIDNFINELWIRAIAFVKQSLFLLYNL